MSVIIAANLVVLVGSPVHLALNSVDLITQGPNNSILLRLIKT